MRIKTLFVRFYKSFNFDYLRKYDHRAQHQPWDMVDGLIFPYVKVPIDGKVTAIVGANESGKSHLLSAIEKGLTGEKIANEDMCRYSEFYTVEAGKRKVPDFGFEFDTLEEEERDLVASFFGDGKEKIESFFFFRNQKNIDLYLPSKRNSKPPHIRLDADKAKKLQKLLPRPFRIKSEIALPNSVPIRSLFDEGTPKNGNVPIKREVRTAAYETINKLAKGSSGIFQTPETVASNAAIIPELMKPLLEAIQSKETDQEIERRREEIKLARDLICKIAKVDTEALKELYNSLKDGKDGHAAGLVDNINRQLSLALNFPNWWVQDKRFELIVSPREVDLVFTILDRTGTEYSFSERSNGLKYFLSYYVQYLAHEPEADGIELLTMDEPDAYLSSQAQQDLLKIFEAFAVPDSPNKKPIQVIYVTHSPFLIDKNHAERIRVLEKGASEEGTRVVKDAGRNHYEPLRSAFGAFVGETVFIGNTNLFVEGMSDQVILAGAANHIRRKSELEDETLDLNRLTIVPAGSASHIPYMVYLARGRDPEKPPIVVLLDSDEAGNEARKALEKGGPRRKEVLPKKYILQLGDIVDGNNLHLPTEKLSDIEDVLPLPLCVLAIKEYLVNFCGADDDTLSRVNENLIIEKIPKAKSLFNAIDSAVKTLSDEFYIEKMGFARSLVDVLSRLPNEKLEPEIVAAVEQFENNMKVLFLRINEMRRKAEREFTSERVSTKIDRLKDAFIRNNPENALRQHAYVLFEGVEDSLDDSPESDAILSALNRIKRDYSIETERHLPIANYENFKNELNEIQYAPLQNAQTQ